MENSFIVIPTRQIKSKSKRQQKKANKRKEDQIKKQINKSLLSKRKAFTKSERKRLVEDLYNNNKTNVTELNNQINDLFDIDDLQSFLDNIISHVQNHVHKYEDLIHQYQSTFLIDIRRYRYKIENYQSLFPLLNEYLNELQSSKYGQNYEKATAHTTPYTILDTLRDLIMETLEEIEFDDDPKYICERIKRRFEQTARDAFYASKQNRQEKLEEIYDLGSEELAEKIHEMLGINI